MPSFQSFCAEPRSHRTRRKPQKKKKQGGPGIFTILVNWIQCKRWKQWKTKIDIFHQVLKKNQVCEYRLDFNHKYSTMMTNDVTSGYDFLIYLPDLCQVRGFTALLTLFYTSTWAITSKNLHKLKNTCNMNNILSPQSPEPPVPDLFSVNLSQSTRAEQSNVNSV